MSAAPPPDLGPLAQLLGTWRGTGRVSYPTIDDRDYREEISFERLAGKAVLAYAQRTHHPATGQPMHSETGYWRAPAPGRVEVVLAHPTGIVEVLEGSAAPGRVELTSTCTAGASTAKEVTALRRRFEIDRDLLRYEVDMAAVGVALTHHLAAELRRVDSP